MINNEIYCYNHTDEKVYALIKPSIYLGNNILTKPILYLRKPKYFIKRKLVNPLLALLTAGITPRKLALTVALGFVIGIFPFFGIASLFCTLVGWRFKLNIPALLLICYLAGPFHLLLYLPFIQLGIWLFNAEVFRFSFDEILKMMQADWLAALKIFGWLIY